MVVLCVALALVILPLFINTREIVFTDAHVPVHGESCRLNGVPGLCVEQYECPEYQKNIPKRNIRRLSCGKHTIFVCCPGISSISGASRSNLYDISKPQNEPASCGKLLSRSAITLRSFYGGNHTAERLIKEGFKLSNFILDGEDRLASFQYENATFGGTHKSDISYIFAVDGGVNASPVLSPHMAIMGEKQGSSVDWFCDGVLINWKWVLTAAHCFKRTPNVVRLGEYDLTYDLNSSNRRYYEDPQEYQLKQYILFPEYRFPSTNHDLALIELHKQTFIDRPDINPICLPWRENHHIPKPNDQVTLTGWGATQFDGAISNILQEVNITVFETSVCDKSYSRLRDYRRKFPSGIKSNTHICAGDPLGGKDACQGDSGGPIFYYSKENRLILAGIVSAGNGCGRKEFPGLYVPIHQPKYLDWIKKVAFATT